MYIYLNNPFGHNVVLISNRCAFGITILVTILESIVQFQANLSCKFECTTHEQSGTEILGSPKNVTYEDHSPMMLPDIIHKMWMGTSGNYKPTSGIRTVLKGFHTSYLQG